jgi:hypothetical protein
MGLVINKLCRLFGWGLAEAKLVVTFSGDPLPPWGTWFLSNIKFLVAIFLIVWCLLLLMALIRKIGLLKLITLSLSPLMRLSGVGPKATMIAVFGMVLGLAYGGGLIIAESKSGAVPREDIYGAIILMALCHSLLEDTILMCSLGGSLWGLLIGRLIFAVALTGLISRMARKPQARNILIGKKYSV